MTFPGLLDSFAGGRHARQTLISRAREASTWQEPSSRKTGVSTSVIRCFAVAKHAP